MNAKRLILVVIALAIGVAGIEVSARKRKEQINENDTLVEVRHNENQMLVHRYKGQGETVQPQFPGGEKAMFQWVAENIKYPSKAVLAHVEGQVMVRFLVDTKGRISDVKVVSSPNKLLDKEAVRVVKSMPRWNPGTIRGEPYNARFAIPVRFKMIR